MTRPLAVARKRATMIRVEALMEEKCLAYARLRESITIFVAY